MRFLPGPTDTQYLAGFVWGENIGWITVGDGSPVDGKQYENADGADTGVNVDVDSNLFGFAWAENVGWVNFDTRDELDPFGQQARYDSTKARLPGYAWGENVGWINLDDAVHFVAVVQLGDFNGDGVLGVEDLLALLGAWGPCPDPPDPCPADLDGDGTVGVTDLLTVLANWS